MKQYGELFLSLDNVGELVQLLEEQLGLDVERVLDHEGILVGCSWCQLETSISLIVPGELEQEEACLHGTSMNKETLGENSRSLSTKLFVPWEMHLPLYVIVNKVGDYGYDDASHVFIKAWVKAYVRILMEELMRGIGGWVPSNPDLVFNKSTWDFDTQLFKYRDIDEIDISNIRDLINTRVMGSTYFQQYL